MRCLETYFLEAFDCFDDVFARIEGTQANVTLSALAETSAGSADDARIVEQVVEEIP